MENEFPIISTVTATYKKYDGLYQTLDSIFAQDYPRIQIVISDDGSNNWIEERKKIRAYIENNKGNNIINYKLLHLEENSGTVKNVSNAIKNCDGEFIKMCGVGDPLFGHNSLSVLFNDSVREKVNIVCGTVQKIDSGSGRVVRLYYPKRIIHKLNSMSPQELFQRLRDNCIIPTQGILIAKKVYLDYGLYDFGYDLLEDHPYWLRVTRNGERVFFEQAICAQYSTGGLSGGGNKDLTRRMYRDYQRMLDVEVRPYENGTFSTFGMWLRERRMKFLFGLSLDGKVKTALHYPDAVLYYLKRKITRI